MQRLLSLLFSTTFSLISVLAGVNPHTRAKLRILSTKEQSMASPCSEDEPYNVLVTLLDAAAAEELRDKGIEVRTCRDKYAILSLPLKDIISLDSNEYIVSASLPRKLQPKLDRARSASMINEVHIGSVGSTELVTGGGSFTGRGVLTALYDSGIDPNHPTFRGSEGATSRITRLWHINAPGNVSLYTDDELTSFTTDNEFSWHGTHTAAIMSGKNPGEGAWRTSFSDGSSEIVKAAIPYYGAAPEAEIAVACGDLSEDAIIEGIENIIEYAKETGRRPVINLSLGMNGGPLDSSDFLPGYLNEIGREEAIVVVSAGNEGNLPISLSHSFISHDDSMLTFFPTTDFSSGVVRPSTVFIYSEDHTVPDVELLLYGTSEQKIVASSKYRFTSSDQSEFGRQFRGEIALAGDIDPANGRGCVVIELNVAVKATSEVMYIPGIKVKNAKGCRTDITTDGSLRLSDCGIPGAVSGDSHLSINSLAVGANVISVGGYITRKYWTTLDGREATNPLTGCAEEGDLAPYSSYGIFSDGRLYPTVTAPGDGIISAVNTYSSTLPPGNYCATYSENNTDYFWDVDCGTSMSSPLVAGVIATWLEAQPTLSIQDIKDILTLTSTRDEHVVSNPISGWGAGKINALDGINRIFEISGTDSLREDEAISLSSITPREYEVRSPSYRDISVNIFSVSGLKLLSVQSATGILKLDLSRLPSGVYIIKVICQDISKSFKIALR